MSKSTWISLTNPIFETIKASVSGGCLFFKKPEREVDCSSCPLYAVAVG
jgi:hypothetical protein